MTKEDNHEGGLKYFLSEYSYEEIQTYYSSKTFYKGLQYYEQERVRNLQFTGVNELTIDVVGSSIYTVTLKLQDQSLLDDCSCPIGGSCKHVVAALLYCVENIHLYFNNEVVSMKADAHQVEKYLNTLSKQQLIQLILKYAPESFKEYVTFSALEPDQSGKILKKISANIDSLFDDDELLYDPSSFEDSLVNHLKKMKGIWKKLPQECGDLIIKIIEKIDDLMDEGYLYDSYHDDIFEGGDLSDIVRSYIYELPFDLKIIFLTNIENAISRMSYSILDSVLFEMEKLFSKEEQPLLKDYFLQQIKNGNLKNAEAYYKGLSNYLTPDEKEWILKTSYHLSEYLTMELVRLYIDKDNKKEAFKIIDSYLHQSKEIYNTAALYIQALNLGKDLGHPLGKLAEEALVKHASIPLLEVAIDHLPYKKAEFENILKEKSTSIFLDYLEKSKRIQEGARLAMTSKNLWDERKFNFFSKNSKNCPEEASTYFIKRIENELEYTGDSHYYIIADTLKALMKIDKLRAKAIAQDIRQEYKRRRNLMAAIQYI